MFRKLLLGLFSLLLLPMMAVQAQASTYEQLVDIYWTYGTDYALETADAFIAQNPNQANAYAWRALLHRETGDDVAAYADVDEGLAVEQTALLYAVRGLFYMQDGEQRTSFQDIDRALAYGTGNLYALYHIAIAYTLDGRDGEALRLLDFVIDNGAFSGAYITRADVYLSQDNMTAAEADLNTAVEQYPGNPNVWIARGMYLEMLGNEVAAIDDYTQAIRQDKRHAIPHARRGLLLASFSDISAALDDFHRAIELAPNNAEILAARGAAFMKMGDDSAALADFNDAIALDDEVAIAYFWRGVLNRDMGDMSAAIDDLSNALANDATILDAYAIRGVLYTETEQFDLAVADYAMLIDRMPSNPPVSTLTQYASALVATGDYATAITIYNDILDNERFNEPALLGRARAYIEVGRYDDALADTQVLTSLDPDYLEAYEMQAEIFEAIGNNEALTNVQLIIDDIRG